MRFTFNSALRIVSLCLLALIVFTMTGARSSKQSKCSSAKTKETMGQYEVSDEQIKTGGTIKASIDDFVNKRRKEPRFKGPFEVGIVYVTFPDTKSKPSYQVMESLTKGVTEYFKKYTQGVCWPVFKILTETPYEAPNLSGTYHVGKSTSNFLGVCNPEPRVAQLCNDAIEYAKKGKKLPPVIAIVYADKMLPFEQLEQIAELRKVYPKPREEESFFKRDFLRIYNPFALLGWGEPLWPNSSILLGESSGAGTLIHELGHVIGAPDFYHMPEPNGGVCDDSTPVYFSGGPTGPLYCRWRYCATLPKDAYAVVKQDTELILAPRWSEFKSNGGKPLGVFIPTSHPNYLLHLEYEPGEFQRMPEREGGCGRYSDEGEKSPDGGIYAYYINVALGCSFLGHPDLCYAYRRNDPTLRGRGNPEAAIFREGDTFDLTSNPKSILPNQLPTGVEVRFGEQTEDGAKIFIKVPQKKITGEALKQSLKPIIEIAEIKDVNPTTILVKTDLTFRGEPLADERGVVYDVKPNPTYPRSPHLMIHGQGFDDVRIINLEPGATVYVRAYAKNMIGVTYSKEQKVKLPLFSKQMPIGPLLVGQFNHLTFGGSGDLSGRVDLSGQMNNTDTIGDEIKQRQNGDLKSATKKLKKEKKEKKQKKKDKKSSKSKTEASETIAQDAHVVVDGSVASALFHLMALRRGPLNGMAPTPKKDVDFNYVHYYPLLFRRYKPTLKGFWVAYDVATALAKKIALCGSSIPDDLETLLIEELDLPKPPKGKPYYVVNLEEGQEDVHQARIYDSLMKGWPVMCVRESSLVSHPIYSVNACLIDGIKYKDGEPIFHIVYTQQYGYDRLPKTKRRTGWHPLSVLTDRISGSGARLIFFPYDNNGRRTKNTSRFKNR